MRVLHILNELRSSGAEVILKVAAPYWREAGLESHILSTGDVPGAFAEALAEAGFIIHHLPFSKTPAFLFEFRNFLRVERFDVVHIYTERANFPYAFIAWTCRIPIIVRTICSTFLFEGRTRFERRWSRALLRLLGVVQVSVGPSVRENEKTCFGNETILIPNWYDDAHFTPPSPMDRRTARNKLKLSPQTRVMISIGNCNGVKNHLSIIQALPFLVDQRMDIVYLHIGEEESGKPERAYVKELGLLPYVRFLGRQEDVLPFLWAADIYVMPSLYEGFSISAIEALACGIPTILTDVPGLRDLRAIVPEVVYTDASPRSLANALMTAFAHKLQPSAESLRRLHDQFGSRMGAQAYAALYHARIKRIN